MSKLVKRKKYNLKVKISNMKPYANLKIICLRDRMKNLKITVIGGERLVELSDKNRTTKYINNY